jgi:phosphoglycolate phosphatase
MAFTNILFDLDGTLVDSAQDVFDALTAAYARCSVSSPINKPVNKKAMGPPLEEMIKNLTPELRRETVDKVALEFRSIYDNHDFHHTHLYEGVSELLARLSKKQKRLFLVTNKRTVPTKKILSKLKLDPFYDVITPDALDRQRLNKTEMIQVLLSKWALRLHETIMVGDSGSDINAAHNSGIKAIGMRNGYGDEEDLIRSQPDYLIPDIRMLEAIV